VIHPPGEEARVSLGTRFQFFAGVESLRGIGALMVAATHFSGLAVNGVSLLPHARWEGVGAFQQTIGGLLLALIVGHGMLMMFFVISGFVLYLCLERGRQGFACAFIDFHAARFLRIYPIAMFAICLVAFFGLRPPGAGAAGGAEVAANLLLIDVSMLPVLWALQLELLTAPIIVLLYFAQRQ